MDGRGQIIEHGPWKIAYDPAGGSFTFCNLQLPLPVIAGSLAGLTFSTAGGGVQSAGIGGGAVDCQEAVLDDVHGHGRQFCYTCPAAGNAPQLAYLINVYDDRPFILLRMLVTNRGQGDLYLHDLDLVRADRRNGGSVKFLERGRPPDFFKVGWHDWVYSGLRHGSERDVNSLPIMRPFVDKAQYNPALPIGRGRGEFWGDGWGLLTDQRSAILAGFASTADQFGVLHVKCRSGASDLTLTAQADGVLLEPGEEFKSEWGYL
ncbi:MAG: hypothetical protein NT177_03225, partial [Chloroflexi bacterium]|nr:hypothetical protein [Chloroflexota bacterium]